MELLEHQIDAVDICLIQRSTLLAYGIGTGKTAIGIACLHPTEKNLIICPASLVKNWEKELEMWGRPENVDVISYNGIKLRGNPPHTIILDEAHAIKNPNAKRTLLTECLCEEATRIVAMTATPVLNRRSEITTILKVLGINTPDLKGTELYDWLTKNNYMLRVKASDVLELPEPIFSKKEIKLSSTEEIITLQNEIKKLYTDSDEDLDKMWANYHMELVGKLSRIRKHVGVSKCADAIKIINEHLSNYPEKPLLVFAHHKQVLETISKTFGAPLLYGKTSLKKRHKFVEEFQKSEHILLVCSILAAGVGLTLTSSHHVIFLEFPWTPAEYDQAYGRAYRKGQDKNVNILDLVSNHRIDIRHEEILHSKRQICDAITDGNQYETMATTQKQLILSILELD